MIELNVLNLIHPIWKLTKTSWHSEKIRFRDASCKLSITEELISFTLDGLPLWDFCKVESGESFSVSFLSLIVSVGEPIEFCLGKKIKGCMRFFKFKFTKNVYHCYKSDRTHLRLVRDGGAIRTLTGVLTFWLLWGDSFGRIDCPNWTLGKRPTAEYLLWWVFSWKEEEGLPLLAQFTTRLVNPGLLTFAYVLEQRW